MRNPLVIEDIEFIENNVDDIREQLGSGFHHYINEWLSDRISFNFWAFFLAPFWMGYRGLYEYAVLYCLLINFTTNRMPNLYLAFLFLFPVYLGFRGNIMCYEKVRSNISKGRKNSGGIIGVITIFTIQMLLFYTIA